MMIQQPELGRKIADYRKSKGLTQEELVDKCNLSVRTLQRIEAGEVTPRTTTMRLIFEALELDYHKSLTLDDESQSGHWEKQLLQFYRSFIDLFNLKTNTMRKISILSVALLALIFGITSITSESYAQSDASVKKIIEKNNANFVKWFNNGEIDSLLTIYRNDACVISRGCGKDYIRDYYSLVYTQIKFTEIEVISVNVDDSLAVEKGRWGALMESGDTIGGEYLAEWKLTNKKWLIVSESTGLAIE